MAVTLVLPSGLPSSSLNTWANCRTECRNIPFQAPNVHHIRTRCNDTYARRDLRILDTIAAMTTGKLGDVLAAAFDKCNGMQLVLANNDLPTDEDEVAAWELISLLSNPEVTDMIHFLPFIFHCCSLNINKQIRQLHTCTGNTLLCVFQSALQVYKQDTNINCESCNISDVIWKICNCYIALSDAISTQQII
ncbi:hypothetical protein QCA50_020445 [Cerrena zonata]|uniref:Uncharacterized protein n=1 Tax=Cerrena zonata TaxID=2478898 RepID=A0AAW0FEL4_9APHY